MESQIQRHGCGGNQTVEVTGSRKPKAEANVCRSQSGEPVVERYRRKKVVRTEEKRSLVTYAKEKHEMSEKQACPTIGISIALHHYKSQRSSDQEIREHLKRLAERKPRWGFGKIRDMLKNQGYSWNHKRIRRIYRKIWVESACQTKEMLTQQRSTAAGSARKGKPKLVTGLYE